MYRINNNIHYIHITPEENISLIKNAGFLYSHNKLLENKLKYVSPYIFYPSSIGKTTKALNNDNNYIYLGRINHADKNETFVEWFKEEAIFSSSALLMLEEPSGFGVTGYRFDRERVPNEIPWTNLMLIKIYRNMPPLFSTRKIIVVENNEPVLYEWKDEEN